MLLAWKRESGELGAKPSHGGSGLMNVLVLGGSGRIGGYILRGLLRHGYIVSSYSRTAPLVEGVPFIQGDITNLDQLKEACHGQDAIIHLAAVPAPGWVPPEQLIRVNTLGTFNVLEAAFREGVGKVVFASSAAAMGFTFQRREVNPRYLPLDEEHPCEPQDEYGLSKLVGELTCKRYSDAYGMQTICLRINANWHLDRKGAEIAVRSGFFRGNSGQYPELRTVEELWSEYRRCIEDPLHPKWGLNNLWAVTDVRDAARAFRLAVENDEIVHEVFLINGDVTCSTVKTRALISRYYPDVPVKTPLEGNASLASNKKAARMLGYRPQYTWRESDFQIWMESDAGR
jgi:nucleoside-diphosphate-sugar epimerase